jgi:hypothetical protein
MIKKYCALFLGFACYLWPCGCVSLQYPGTERRISSSQIAKDQVDIIKSVILNEGYVRTSEDDHRSCVNYVSGIDCVIRTRYGKIIPAARANGTVHVGLAYKETEPPTRFYRGLAIYIADVDRGSVPETNVEIDRIEGILYEKLLELVGKENVVRGDREDTALQRPGFYAPYVGRPPPR